MVVGIAILGGGIFIRTAHIPSLKLLGERVNVVGLYSRRKETAEESAALFEEGKRPAVFFGEVGEQHEESLSALLARSDVAAVIIALPVGVQPEVIRLCLENGKHVLSEKPIAGNLGAGVALVADYEKNFAHKGLVFEVAENYRYEPAFDRAAELAGNIGGVHLAELRCHCPMPNDNVYKNTEWRKKPDYIGGYLLDGGVHFVAALRKIVKGAGQGEIKDVVGISGAFDATVPPPDTIVGAVRWSGGLVGSVAISFATRSRLLQITIKGEKGDIVVERGARPGYVVIYRPHGGEPSEEFFPFQGVELETDGFLKSIAVGMPSRNHPLEALRDLEIINGLLESSSSGQRVACDRPLQ